MRATKDAPHVDDPVQRADHVGRVAELSTLVQAVEEDALERPGRQPILRSRTEEQQAGDRGDHSAGVVGGEAQVRQQPRALRGVREVGKAANVLKVAAHQRVVELSERCVGHRQTLVLHPAGLEHEWPISSRVASCTSLSMRTSMRVQNYPQSSK